MKSYLAIISFLACCFVQSSRAEDLTKTFDQLYAEDTKLTKAEIKYLKTKEVILIPGIMSESFRPMDGKSILDLSLLMSSYFSPQKDFFDDKKVKVTRVRASSDEIETTRKKIRNNFEKLRKKKKTAIFMTHSLGGLVLLDHLLASQEDWKHVSGIVFLQSPFLGAPLASVYMQDPPLLLRPLLIFVNVNKETIDYLSAETRAKFFEENEEKIKKLLKAIPVITVTTVANGFYSIFQPAIDIIRTGCMRNLKGMCMSEILFEGPFDDSDGMVPVKNSRLLDADFVKIMGVDHGEMILKTPFTTYSKNKTTEVLTKMLVKKIQN